MKTILKPFWFILSLPLYIVAYLASLLALLALRGVDWIYPDSKASVSFIKAIMGFNTSQIDMGAKPRTKPLGIRIYK